MFAGGIKADYTGQRMAPDVTQSHSMPRPDGNSGNSAGTQSMMINRSSYLADAERDRARSRGIQRTVGSERREGSTGRKESKNRRQFLSVASEVKQHIVLGNAVKKSASLKSVHSYSMMINQPATATLHPNACNTVRTVHRRPITARAPQPASNLQYDQSSTMIPRSSTPPSSTVNHSIHQTPSRQNASFFNHAPGQSNSLQMNNQQSTHLRQPRSTTSTTSMPSTPVKLLTMGEQSLSQMGQVTNSSSQMRELVHRLNTQGRGAYMNKGMSGTVQGNNGNSMNGRNSSQKAIAMLSDPRLSFPGAPVYRVVSKKEMPITITPRNHHIPVESNTSIERLQTHPLNCEGESKTTVAPAINPASSFNHIADSNTNAPHLQSQIPQSSDYMMKLSMQIASMSSERKLTQSRISKKLDLITERALSLNKQHQKEGQGQGQQNQEQVQGQSRQGQVPQQIQGQGPAPSPAKNETTNQVFTARYSQSMNRTSNVTFSEPCKERMSLEFTALRGPNQSHTYPKNKENQQSSSGSAARGHILNRIFS